MGNVFSDKLTMDQFDKLLEFEEFLFGKILKVKEDDKF